MVEKCVLPAMEAYIRYKENGKQCKIIKQFFSLSLLRVVLGIALAKRFTTKTFFFCTCKLWFRMIKYTNTFMLYV